MIYENISSKTLFEVFERKGLVGIKVEKDENIRYESHNSGPISVILGLERNKPAKRTSTCQIQTSPSTGLIPNTHLLLSRFKVKEILIFCEFGLNLRVNSLGLEGLHLIHSYVVINLLKQAKYSRSQYPFSKLVNWILIEKF